MAHWVGSSRTNVTSTQSGEDGKGDGGADETDGETEAAPGGAAGAAGGAAGAAGGAAGAAALVAVRAPLPGTFYRAPRPGAAPFVEVGSRVSADTVIGIVETMKLMNSVAAGVAGTVAEFCLANAEFAAHGATLMRIRADP
jgi:acetyl-CoA carboxylase biotin carboxyl carrier protein